MTQDGVFNLYVETWRQKKKEPRETEDKQWLQKEGQRSRYALEAWVSPACGDVALESVLKEASGKLEMTVCGFTCLITAASSIGTQDNLQGLSTPS